MIIIIIIIIIIIMIIIIIIIIIIKMIIIPHVLSFFCELFLCFLFDSELTLLHANLSVLELV